MELTVKYSDVKERLLKANNEDEKFKENLRLMDTPLSKDNYGKLVKLVLGDDVDISKISPADFMKLLISLSRDYGRDNDDRLSAICGVLETIQGNLVDGVQVLENDDDKEDNYTINYIELDKELEDEESLEVSYDVLVSEYKKLNDTEVEKFISKIEQSNIIDAQISYRVFEAVAHFILAKGKDGFDLSKIDSRDLTKFTKKVEKDFKQVEKQLTKELVELEEEQRVDEQENDDIVNLDIEKKKEELQKEIDFHSIWSKRIETIHKALKNYDGNVLNEGQPKYNIEYKPSQTKPKFKFKGIDTKKYVKSVKNIFVNFINYVKENKINILCGAAGALGGLATATFVPMTVLPGGIIMALSSVKLTTAVWKKGKIHINKYKSKRGEEFGNSEGDKVIEVIDDFMNKTENIVLLKSLKEKIKNIEITKKSYDEDGNEEIVETIKLKDDEKFKKFINGRNNIRNFLNRSEVQWFKNGFSIGYIAGNVLDLNDKWNVSRSDSVKVEAYDEYTQSKVDSIIEDQIKTETLQDSYNSITDNISTEEISNYDWLDIGKDGDKIDLSAMKKGYYDSYAARGAYTGEYEHLNKAVNLATQYATEANGTFISEIRLPDGSTFTGKMTDLFEMLSEKGIDISDCAANVANNTGDYAWGNLEEVLEVLPKKLVKRG